MPVLQLPLKRRNLLERSTAHRGGYLPEGFEEGTTAGGQRRKSLAGSLLGIFAGARVRWGSKATGSSQTESPAMSATPRERTGAHPASKCGAGFRSKNAFLVFDFAAE